MIKTITILLFFISSVNIHSQNSDLLTGKWIFKKALNKEVDDEGRETLNSEIINKMTFEFKSNSEFVGFAFGQNVKGNWALSKDLKKIILNIGKEKTDFTILKLTETELILKIGLGEFLMKKS